MLNLLLKGFVITVGLIGSAMAQERILISSDSGKVTAELVDNNATRALIRMLPLTIEMRDHLRQETARFLDRDTRALELQSLRHLLPRRARPSARDHLARPGDG
jgi:hypothetical protein